MATSTTILPLARSEPRTIVKETPPATQPKSLENVLFDHRIDGMNTPGLRWQYNQTLASQRTCAFGQRTTLLWQPTTTTPPFSLRHLALRITMPPLLTRRHADLKFWRPHVVWHLFDRIEFYIGENSEPVASVYPDMNAILLKTTRNTLERHAYKTLLTQFDLLDDEVVQRDLIRETWYFDMPLILPCTSGATDRQQWLVHGLGNQPIRMVITMRDAVDCVMLDEKLERKKRDPAYLAKRYQLPPSVTVEWMASTGHASQQHAATLGFHPSRTAYKIPWPSVHRVGQLHAHTWENTFGDMSYWQLSLHDTALTSAFVFVLHYDTMEDCAEDTLPFEAIEILHGIERLTKITYEDTLRLATAILGDGKLDTASQVLLVPFSDDPLAQESTYDKVSFLNLSTAPITVRVLQPSRRATKTMLHIKVYAVRLAVLNWSTTTSSLDTLRT